jgi:hypothetical protein
MHEKTNGKEKKPKEFLPEELAKNTLCVEEIFGASWVTAVCHVMRGDESRTEIQALYGKGIEPVQIAWEE